MALHHPTEPLSLVESSKVPLENVTDESLLEEAKRVVRVEKNRWAGTWGVPPPAGPLPPASLPTGCAWPAFTPSHLPASSPAAGGKARITRGWTGWALSFPSSCVSASAAAGLRAPSTAASCCRPAHLLPACPQGSAPTNGALGFSLISKYVPMLRHSWAPPACAAAGQRSLALPTPSQAGLSVAAMVVPQGMSYSQNLAFLPQARTSGPACSTASMAALACRAHNLPPLLRLLRRPPAAPPLSPCSASMSCPSSPPQVYGLYGAFTPCIFYALLGSSKQLAVGPVAVTSLILGSGLSDIYGKFAVNPSDPENALIGYKQQQYNVGAIQASARGRWAALVGGGVHAPRLHTCYCLPPAAHAAARSPPPLPRRWRSSRACSTRAWASFASALWCASCRTP